MKLRSSAGLMEGTDFVACQVIMSLLPHSLRLFGRRRKQRLMNLFLVPEIIAEKRSRSLFVCFIESAFWTNRRVSFADDGDSGM